MLALVLVAVMVFGLATTAFAATSTTGNLTINDTRTGRTYVAYQIVYGDVTGTEDSATDPLVLTNIRWGDGQTAHTKDTLLTAEELTALPTSNADRAAIETFINTVGLASSTTYTATAVSAGYQFTSIPAGWYVVKETTNTVGTDDFTSAFIVEVVGNAAATPKGSKTTVEKKVDDVNDSDSSTGAWNEKDSADYDIGDEIVFTLTATIGNDLTDYDSYKLVFTDNLSKGLDYKELVSVTVDETRKENTVVTVADGTTYSNGSSTAYEGGSIKTFTIDNVLADSVGAKAGSKIVIKYKATLNTNAVVGSAGNPNKVYLEYSNNPDVSTEFGKTPEDTNKVFTYKVKVNKVDEESNALNGADFTLYKQVASTVTGAKTGSEIKNTLTTANRSVKADALGDEKYYIAVGQKTGSTAGSTFEFNGIDDGTYVLVETTIPDGRNAWDSVEFTVSATHDETSADPQLTQLTGGDAFSGNAGSATLDTGVLEKSIMNLSGSTLPSTGGIGTTIFYVLGAILVIGAGVILVTRRRMSNAK